MNAEHKAALGNADHSILTAITTLSAALGTGRKPTSRQLDEAISLLRRARRSLQPFISEVETAA